MAEGNSDTGVATFLLEAEEIFDHLENELELLEGDENPKETIASLFRGIHTLKGSALVVGMRALGELAHVIEELFSRWRDERLAPTGAQVAWSQQALQMLRSTLQQEIGAVSGGADVAESDRNVQATVLRVDLSKLDALASTVGELALSRAREQELVNRLPLEHRGELLEAFEASERHHEDLQERSLRLRLVPFAPLFAKLVRAANQVARKTGKAVSIVTQGADLEVDATIVSNLSDPLLHIVRNAVDHGIEASEDRVRRGKPASGTITLVARRLAGQVVVEIRDDGRGLDRERIVAKAIERRRLDGSEVVTDALLADLIFEPGFSTAQEVTDVSGRGVGMDVVRSNVQAMRGQITVRTEPGLGSIFELRVPLALSIMLGFQVRVGQSCFVLPSDAVEHCLDAPALRLVPGARDGGECIRYDERMVPLVQLGKVLGLPGEAEPRAPAVLVRANDEMVALRVDAVLGEQQTVVRTLGPLFLSIPAVSGATLLGDGNVALLLDVARVVEAAKASLGATVHEG